MSGLITYWRSRQRQGHDEVAGVVDERLVELGVIAEPERWGLPEELRPKTYDEVYPDSEAS